MTVAYSPEIYRRAELALRCSPFAYALLATMVDGSVDLADIGDRRGFQQGYTIRPLSEPVAEAELMWLIQVGVIRREVDGQGITSRYRLAPIGRQVLAQLTADRPVGGSANGVERLWNQLLRWRILR
jgi:hypothetical protein